MDEIIDSLVNKVIDMPTEHEHTWHQAHCVEKAPGSNWGPTVMFRHCECGATQEHTSVNLGYEETFGTIVDKGVSLIEAYLDVRSIDDDGWIASLVGWINIDGDRFDKLQTLNLQQKEEAQQRADTYKAQKIDNAIKFLKYEGLLPLDPGEKKEDFAYLSPYSSGF